MRAKDKNFNADFKTDFDEVIGKINIVPAGYWKSVAQSDQQCFLCSQVKEKNKKEKIMKPTVIISTRNIGGRSFDIV